MIYSGISIMLGVLLCVSLLGIILLSCLLTKDMDDRAGDKRMQAVERRDLLRLLAASRQPSIDHAPRHFYDWAKENAPGGNDTESEQ